MTRVALPVRPVSLAPTRSFPSLVPLVTAVLLGLASSSLLAAAAGAALSEIDDPSLPASADGFNLTVDDVTGLEWLDLTVTAGRTYDDIVGNDGSDELGPGGDFEGFRYATDLEVTGWTASGQVDSLFSNFGMGSTFGSIGGYALVRSYFTYVGCEGSCGTYGFVQGLCFDDVNPSAAIWFAAEAFPSQGSNFGSLGYSLVAPLTSRPTNGSISTSGHFLVRPSPEPAAGLSMLAGASWLALLGRRSSRRGRPRP